VKALLLSAERASLAEAEGRLVRWGFEVAWFDDAVTAWRSCRSDPPGLYLLEWPKDDLAVLEFCRRIRSAANGHLRFVWILTDRTGPAIARALIDYGADDCIHLPLDGETLDVRLAAVKRRIIETQDRDQIQEALRRSNERFDLAVSGANEGLWDALVLPGVPWHSPETPVWYSPRLKEMLGFRDDEFPNVLESWLVLLHPDDRDRILQAVADHVERRVTYDEEYRLRTKSGEYRWFSARGLGIWDAAGEMTRMAGSLRDITETRRTADALKSSEEKWRGLVEHAPDYILVVDLDGTIRFINRVGPDYKIEEVIGANALDFGPVHDRQRVKDAIDSVARTGQPTQMETSVNHPDGSVGWYASRLGPIERDGRVESVIIITTDISDRKQSEAALRREQEFLRRLLDLQERDRQLVAYEIHDGMVQEMTGALMHLEAFKHADNQRLREQEFERGSRLLREAVNEARRLISGLRPPVIDDLGVVAAVEYLINEARADLPNIEYVHRTTFDRLVPPLESAIFRIVQEALSNVRKHSGTRRARVELIETGNTLRLSIRDWGCGFDPDKVSRERFGLQGIRQRARLLGTTAIVESTPGKGALIAVDLPLIHAEQDAPASETRSAANGDTDEADQVSEVVPAADAES
jgi:PAS domain S-box-containing protein